MSRKAARAAELDSTGDAKRASERARKREREPYQTNNLDQDLSDYDFFPPKFDISIIEPLSEIPMHSNVVVDCIKGMCINNIFCSIASPPNIKIRDRKQ